MTDVLDGDRRAVETTIGIVGKVGRDDLDRPTPCAGWTLGALLAHMIGQHYGFAAAAEGDSQDAAVFADRPVGERPASTRDRAGGGWRRSARPDGSRAPCICPRFAAA